MPTHSCGHNCEDNPSDKQRDIGPHSFQNSTKEIVTFYCHSCTFFFWPLPFQFVSACLSSIADVRCSIKCRKNWRDFLLVSCMLTNHLFSKRLTQNNVTISHISTHTSDASVFHVMKQYTFYFLDIAPSTVIPQADLRKMF